MVSNDLRIGGLNLHDRVGHINDLLLGGLLDDRVGDDDHLLRSGFEHAGGIRLGAQGLDGVHQLLLLVEERLTQIHRPGELIIHRLDHGGELRQGLHVVIPRLSVHLRDVVGVLHEPRRLHNLQRIHGGRQDDGDQRIGMQGLINGWSLPHSTGGEGQTHR